MGLCKCPKRQVTNQFCFEHRVNVCEHCMIQSHPKCIVQSYLSWLRDSDYIANCTLCSTSLEEGECVRLVCYHVFHWDCLNARQSALPANTAPRGHQCPICNAEIFPPPNLVSAVADVLKNYLSQVNWGRNGLGLALLPEDANASSLQYHAAKQQIPSTAAISSMTKVHHSGVERTKTNGTSSGLFSETTMKKDSPHSVLLMDAFNPPSSNDKHVSSFPSEQGREHGENGWYIPQEDDSFEWMDLDEWEEIQNKYEMQQYARGFTLSPVSFYLYTQANPEKYQKISTTTQSVKESNFNPKNPTRFVIHGWISGRRSSMNKEISRAWLSNGDYNIIVVDWARARSLDYISSALDVPAVGKKVAAMIDFLVENNDMSLDTLDVIGHSLGAHVAGFAGKNTKSGQIHTIIGLDPALPLFSYNKPNKRLNSTDAYYVETIQTDGGQLGFLKPIGRGAFYPNGGKKQPGCGWDLTGACSHNRSPTYYAEAVQKDDFPSMKCSAYQDAVSKACGTTYSPVRMGAVTNAYMVGGDYYVPVHKKAPFGMGA